jgi:hypothetical protein
VWVSRTITIIQQTSLIINASATLFATFRATVVAPNARRPLDRLIVTHKHIVCRGDEHEQVTIATHKALNIRFFAVFLPE